MSDLTPAEYAAIRDYALTKGRTWRWALLSDWANAAAPGHLQALRNRLGPAWLARFKLPRNFWNLTEAERKSLGLID